MDNDEQRDFAEEKYNREFCVPCGTSPCTWDGQPDGFHTDEAGRTILQAARVTPWHGLARPDEALDDAALTEARELDDWSPADLLALVHTAGELWLSTDRADPDDVLNEYQRSLLERAAAAHRAETGEDEAEEDDRSGTRFGDWLDERPLDEPEPGTWVQYYDPDTGAPLPGPPDTLRELREGS